MSTISTPRVQARKWVLAVDGSRVAEDAFYSTLPLLNNDPTFSAPDRLSVLHFDTSRAEDVPAMTVSQQPVHVMHHVQEVLRHAQAMYGMGHSLHSSIDASLETVRCSSGELVLKLIEKSSDADYLVVGASGYRTEKLGSSGPGHPLGSLATASVAETHCNTIVMKSFAAPTRELPAGLLEKLVFVVPVDSSEASASAFQVALRLAQPGRDQILCVHVSGSRDASPFDRLKQMVGKSPHPHVVEFDLQGRSQTTSIGEQICHYASEKQAHFIVMGSEILLKHRLGSVCLYCVNHALCSVVVTKPRN